MARGVKGGHAVALHRTGQAPKRGQRGGREPGVGREVPYGITMCLQVESTIAAEHQVPAKREISARGGAHEERLEICSVSTGLSGVSDWMIIVESATPWR